MNGWITIGAKLDSKQLEKDITKTKRDLEKYSKEADKLTSRKAQIEFDNKNIKETIDNYNKLTARAEKYKQIMKEKDTFANPRVNQEQQIADAEAYRTAQQKLEKINVEISKQVNNYKKAQVQLEKNNYKISEIDKSLQKNKSSQNEVNQRLKNNVELLEKAKKQEGMQNVFDKMKSGADGVKNSMKDIVKQALRWGLAIFGIRTAFNFLRSSISTISQYNEQVATDIEYIRFALASTLEPVILRIISLVKTLLYYIGYIAKAWFGVDLFAGASVDKFKSAKKELGGATKQAKELNKQLAGFDEMNVLQDNNDTGGGGGGASSGAMPSFDLSQFEGEIPDWLKWIVDNKDLIFAIISGVIVGLNAWKLGLDAIKSIGLGLVIAGIVYAIMGLLEYLKDPSWKNFGKIIQGIGVALVGLGIMIESIPLAVAGAIVLIVGTIIKYWDEIKAFIQNIIDWLTGKSDWVHQMFGDTIGDIYDAFINVMQKFLDSFDVLFTSIKRILDDIIGIVKAIISGDWKKAWELAKDIFKTICNAMEKIIQNTFNAIWGVIKNIGSAVGNVLWGLIKGAINGILNMVETTINAPIRMLNSAIGLINKIPGVSISRINTFSLPRLAKGGIINQPGRGVAIGGESGREGVIPLTDSQQMAMLGEAIGKYITINASITNTMNGRVISRELKTIQNENDFAFNR